MKVERIALEEFKRFRAPLVLDGLSDGLNLFIGDNEAGKSTVATAVRAAFLERARTKAVTDFAPWGSSGARPSVALDFRIGDVRYQLRKYFLNKSRCELVIDGGRQRLEGEAAEDALAHLLGFEFSAKGQSQAKQAGIPGLLWIRQGEGQELVDPANHAELHLRDALTRLTGEMASSDGDRLFTRVSTERAALLDARAGRPKGIYREAEEALAAAQTLVGALQAEKAQLDADVDRLAQLRAVHLAAERDQPWHAFDLQAQAARQRLEEIGATRAARDALQREHDAALAMLEALQSQVGRDLEDEDALASQRREAKALQASASAAQAVQQASADNLARCDAAWKQAQQQHAHVQAHVELQDIDEQLARWTAESARLIEAIAQASAVQQVVENVTQRLSATSFESGDLHALREHARVLAECTIRQEVAATRLSYRLHPGVMIRTLRDGDLTQTTTLATTQETSQGETQGETQRETQDGARNASLEALPGELVHNALHGEGERLLSEALTLDIEGVGRLHIAPGGQDLSALATTLQATRKAFGDCLARMGVASLDAAESAWAHREADQRNLDAARKEWRIRAPEGIDVLRASLQAGEHRHEALVLRRQRLSDAFASTAAADAVGGVGNAVGVSLAQALAWVNTCQADLKQAELAYTNAQSQWQNQTARIRLLDEQIARQAAMLALPERQHERQRRATRLIEQRSLAEDVRRRIAEAERLLASQQPALVEQDCQRFERSAAAARASHQTRHHEILTLMGRLEQAGARGIGEDLLRALADVERLDRRRGEIALRASGLDLLANLLQEKRETATRRLQTPLARRLNHYLPLLFPGATLRLGDDLLPVDLHRQGDQQDALHALSFGTREQLGLLVRLAYADLLREAGRPTLLILDDALVHADSARRGLMKRALFDAASRHQILMFTCHGEAWQDLGVIPRPLG